MLSKEAYGEARLSSLGSSTAKRSFGTICCELRKLQEEDDRHSIRDTGDNRWASVLSQRVDWCRAMLFYLTKPDTKYWILEVIVNQFLITKTIDMCIEGNYFITKLKKISTLTSLTNVATLHACITI